MNGQCLRFLLDNDGREQFFECLSELGISERAKQEAFRDRFVLDSDMDMVQHWSPANLLQWLKSRCCLRSVDTVWELSRRMLR